MTGSPHSLLTPVAVRERAREVLGAAFEGKLDSFTVAPERLPHVADRLAAFTAEELAQGLQVSAVNPVVGLDGRAAAIARLGITVAAKPTVFSRTDTPRPGGLFDALVAQCDGAALPAARILEAL